MLGISFDTWVKIAAIVTGGIVIIIGNRTHVNKVIKEMREDRRKRQVERRKYRAKAEENHRKQLAAILKARGIENPADRSPEKPAQ